MAEAATAEKKRKDLAKNAFQHWRETKTKRELKSAGNHKFADADESVTLIQKGCDLIKLRNASKKYPRTYFLDPDLENLCWTPSKKGDRARIPVSSFKEIREGNMSDAFSQCNEVFPEERCFSIIHGDSFVPLDLVASTREDSVHWLIGLRYLMAKISGEDEHSQRQRARDQWLREMFITADKSGDGLLSFEEVLSLMHKINVKISNKQLKETFKSADTNTEDSEGLLDFQEFAAFYKSISTRPEIYMLLMKYGHGKESLGKEELLNFLVTEQGLKEVDQALCKNIIEKHEPSEANRNNEVLGIDGLTNYLLSADGEIFNPQHRNVYQDMSKPLTNYFIASSHNTYLLGDQLTSSSSMDIYVRVLQSGCRCLELDCWNGKDGEPVVYHGYTMTSKVKFRYIILNINDYAFTTNRYPVILSIENHCNIEQQRFMADFMKKTFKDKLVNACQYEEKDLPSPKDLMGKILIKTKKLPSGLSEELDEGEVTEEDSADEMDDCFKFRSDDNETVHRMKERKCRRTLASLSRLRMNKEDDESDARGDLSSAIVSSVAEEENPDIVTKSTSKFSRSFSAKEYNKGNEVDKKPTRRHSFSSSIRKKIKWRSKRSRTLSRGESDFKRTIRLSRQLSDLVTYTPSMSFKGLHVDQNASRLQVVSIPESKAYRFTDTKAAQFVKYTRCKLCRIYPAGYRIDSSNPNPQCFWNCGCQLVALNYQSDGRMLQINKGRFLANGNCGYILKPDAMVKEDCKFDPMSGKELAGDTKKLLKIRVISGQQLPKPKDSILGDRGEIIDPYVEIECIGLPVDCCKQRTKTIEDNGFNPVWQETLDFLLRLSDLALVRFVVWDEDPIGRDFIGQFTLPFTSMMPGYRHIHLEGLDQATIFVHVSISDYQGSDKGNEVPEHKKSRHQSGGVKFKKRLMRNNTIL